MIAAGMRRAEPGNQQARAIEQISSDALRDMQALLVELRPASADGAGLAPALREICSGLGRFQRADCSPAWSVLTRNASSRRANGRSGALLNGGVHAVP
jgi:glucose-6-phosphate-specific signal transduction histidine kinase